MMARYSVLIRLLLFALFVDLFFNGISPSFQGPIALSGALVGVQAISILFVIGVLYAMVSQTLMFSWGLFGGVLRLLRSVIIFTSFHAVFLIGAHAYRIILIVQGDTPSTAWTHWWFWILFFAQQIVAISYYVCVIRTIFVLSDPKLYYPTTTTITTTTTNTSTSNKSATDD